jgi:hypothetical protein
MKTKLLSVLVLTLPLLSSVCFGQYENRNRGLALGGLMGALTGGAIGHHNGEAAEGALIGAGVGALAGAVIGDSVDNEIARNNVYAQQQYDRQISGAVSVQDAIAMSQAKLSDNVIVTHIQANGVLARPQPNDLIVMRNAGVSDAVIQTMQTARLATALPPPPRPAYRGVIVERHYVAPPPVWYHHHYDPYWDHCHGPHYYRPGLHWGVTFGH